MSYSFATSLFSQVRELLSAGYGPDRIAKSLAMHYDDVIVLINVVQQTVT